MNLKNEIQARKKKFKCKMNLIKLIQSDPIFKELYKYETKKNS